MGQVQGPRSVHSGAGALLSERRQPLPVSGLGVQGATACLQDFWQAECASFLNDFDSESISD